MNIYILVENISKEGGNKIIFVVTCNPENSMNRDTQFPQAFQLIQISRLENMARTCFEIFHKNVFYRIEKRKHGATRDMCRESALT